MKALITGASSGIGREMAIVLGNMGYDLILVARRMEKLEELSEMLAVEVCSIGLDLSEEEACFELYEQVKGQNVDILINNAGFGIFGEFKGVDLDRELEMINVNIKAVHILTKLFLKDFTRKNSGYILNIASSAAFLPGPLLSGYYATKAYVLHLTQAVYEELRRDGSKVYIGSLCPGPVDTEFNQTAKVKSGVNGLASCYVAEYAIEQMFKRKLTIVPGVEMKLAMFFQRFVPTKLLLKITYRLQKRKDG
jgi:short-subunit dehydrogenase